MGVSFVVGEVGEATGEMSPPMGAAVVGLVKVAGYGLLGGP